MCRRLFRSPWRSHWALSGVPRRPFTLEFRGGGRLTCSSLRETRPVWDYLLEHPGQPDGMCVEDGTLCVTLDGLTLALRPQTYDFYFFSEIYRDDVYRLRDLPRPVGTVVDLGANVGLFSIRAAALGAEHVIAVEPVSTIREVARRNLERAGFAQRVRLVDAAVGATSGEEVPIFLSRTNTGAHSMYRELTSIQAVAGVETARTLSIADLFEREGIERCDLLKCDVEGAEFDALAATPPETLSRVRRIAIEVHLTRDLPQNRIEDLRGHLRACGFRLEERQVRRQEGAVRLVMLYGVR